MSLDGLLTETLLPEGPFRQLAAFWTTVYSRSYSGKEVVLACPEVNASQMWKLYHLHPNHLKSLIKSEDSQMQPKT